MSSTMTFRQRLFRYMIGMALGLGLVFLMFGPRGCGNWLPGNQVKKWIRENNQNIEVSSKANCQIKCMELEYEDIYVVLSDKGDVEFEQSQTKGYPKEYVISGERENEAEFKFGFILREDSSSVVSFAERLDKTFDCDCK